MSNDTRAIRLVIADQKSFVRQNLYQLFDPESELRVVGEAEHADGATQLIHEVKPDILMIDFDLAQDLAFQELHNPPDSPPLRIVVMVQEIQKSHIVEAFLLGAHGIVLKTSPSKTLIESIRRVMAGQYWLEHESTGLLVEILREALPRRSEPAPTKDYGLTRRELDIIKKIVNGRSNKEVGEEFSISERTVKHHLTNIFGKIGVTSRLQLALFAVNHHLMSHPSNISHSSEDVQRRMTTSA